MMETALYGLLVVNILLAGLSFRMLKSLRRMWHEQNLYHHPVQRRIKELRGQGEEERATRLKGYLDHVDEALSEARKDAYDEARDEASRRPGHAHNELPPEEA